MTGPCIVRIERAPDPECRGLFVYRLAGVEWAPWTLNEQADAVYRLVAQPRRFVDMTMLRAGSGTQDRRKAIQQALRRTIGLMAQASPEFGAAVGHDADEEGAGLHVVTDGSKVLARIVPPRGWVIDCR